MSPMRKVLIGAGAAMLILVMVLAAFSVGVYVGNRGLLVGTLRDFGARLAQEQAPAQPAIRPEQQLPEAPVGPAQGLPLGPPALVGRVGAVTNEGLIIQTPQGPRLVEVDTDTEVRDVEGQELSLMNVRQGMQVAVFGEFSPNGRRLNAETILVLPPAQP